jgi:hypothetical protein
MIIDVTSVTTGQQQCRKLRFSSQLVQLHSVQTLAMHGWKTVHQRAISIIIVYSQTRILTLASIRHRVVVPTKDVRYLDMLNIWDPRISL